MLDYDSHTKKILQKLLSFISFLFKLFFLFFSIGIMQMKTQHYSHTEEANHLQDDGVHQMIACTSQDGEIYGKNNN